MAIMQCFTDVIKRVSSGPCLDHGMASRCRPSGCFNHMSMAHGAHSASVSVSLVGLPACGDTTRGLQWWHAQPARANNILMIRHQWAPRQSHQCSERLVMLMSRGDHTPHESTYSLT